MGKAGYLWGAAFALAGVALLARWVPAPDSAARIGMGAFLLMVGLLMAAVPATKWFLRRTTKPDDYQGGCPVGARCACGHFNLKPRKACKACGAATVFPA